MALASSMYRESLRFVQNDSSGDRAALFGSLAVYKHGHGSVVLQETLSFCRRLVGRFW
jgi:hypothetical protein